VHGKHLTAAGHWRQQQQGYHRHDQQSNLHGCQCERKILDLFSAVPCKLTIELGFAQQYELVHMHNGLCFE